MSPAEDSGWNIAKVCCGTIEWCGWLPYDEKKLYVFNRFDTIPTCDRQTDKRTDGRTDRQTDKRTSCHSIFLAHAEHRAVKMRTTDRVTELLTR